MSKIKNVGHAAKAAKAKIKNEKAAAKASTESDETKIGEVYYQTLQSQAMEAVGSVFNTTLYPIQYPSQGDFMWYYQNINQVFNQSTFDYLSANVSPGELEDTIQISSSGGFPNNYTQVLNSIIYSLSAANQAELDKYQTLAATQQQTVISDYQNTYGTITEEQMEEANQSTKIDYVISYIMGEIWSCTQQNGEKPVTWTEMAAARNLKDLLPCAPASGDKVINDVAIYLNMMAPVNGLQDKMQNGSWVIQSLKTNTQYPSEANGGMKTFNPNTGAVSESYNVGYAISSSLASITNDLENTSRTIQMTLDTSAASGSEVNVSVEGQTGVSIGSWLNFSTSTGMTYDMSQAEGTSKDAAVSITWEGYSMVPCAPTAWQQATNVGWYYGDVIRQAVANEGQDVDGFKWIGDQPPYDMSSIADGGDFGQLTNLLISNYPTISITYSNADFEAFKESWSETVSGNLSLFGFISLGSFSEGAYGSSYEEGSSNNTFTLTFSASPAVVGVPQEQQQAFVIGGSVDNPGDQS